mmetsp:Transcript_71349/g.140089  ORF Transcript_71349/g.140089 Transcript_71349/m.140089 type:complete len:90 (-) Transcript_71349:70-339(-)
MPSPFAEKSRYVAVQMNLAVVVLVVSVNFVDAENRQAALNVMLFVEFAHQMEVAHQSIVSHYNLCRLERCKVVYLQYNSLLCAHHLQHS